MIRNFSRSHGTYNLLILVKDSSDPRSAGPIIRHFFLRELFAANMGGLPKQAAVQTIERSVVRWHN